MIEKVRLKKHQKPKIEEWCKALEITESRFVEDAITFYLRQLEGKTAITPIAFSVPISEHANLVPVVMTEDVEDFDGGIDL